ncbi:MAG: Cysteine protease atg4 [Cirrosporium novae-zelandiae]|nr:MAG: Cysteine protease atg4 [Cirrosporium novae-zelandiae]
MSSSVKIPGMNNVDLGRYSKRLVQYFWDPEPKNNESPECPIWCLGKHYRIPVQPTEEPSSPVPRTPRERSPSNSALSHASLESTTPPTSTDESLDDAPVRIEHADSPVDSVEEDGGWPMGFLDDFESKIWLTYRSGFAPIAKSKNPDAFSSMTFSVRLRSQLLEQEGFTSDTGYGCMIRSGQMLLANTLSILQLGRDWRRGSKPEEERRLLAQFADDHRAPFSIHRFVEHGAQACGKHPGEWFGPSATAECIKALSHQCAEVGLKVYVTGNGSDIHENEFLEIACPDGKAFSPTLILFGTRLGIDRVTPVYWEGLKSILQMPQSVGIAGGRPSASHYFIGVQNHSFFYLDPHTTRPALSYLSPTPAEVDSCHTRRLHRLHVKDLDPSMLMGFLIRSAEEWKTWKQNINHAQGKSIIHVSDEREDGEDGKSVIREGAVDEVETLDESEEEDASENEDGKSIVTVTAEDTSS